MRALQVRAGIAAPLADPPNRTSVPFGGQPGRLTLVRVADEDQNDPGGGAETRKKAPLFLLEEFPPATLTELWVIVDAIATLLTLAVDAPTPPVWLEVYGTDVGWVEVEDPRIETEHVGQPVQSWSMLLPQVHLSIEYVATWTQQYPRLRPIPDLVATTIGISPRALEGSLLDLCTALEGLHARSDLPGENADLTAYQARAARWAAVKAVGEDGAAAKRICDALSHARSVSYAERLRALLERAPLRLIGYDEASQEEWVQLIKATRNGFAHRKTEIEAPGATRCNGGPLGRTARLIQLAALAADGPAARRGRRAGGSHPASDGGACGIPEGPVADADMVTRHL